MKSLKVKNSNHTLESSIKLLAELTISDLQHCNNKSSSNTSGTRVSLSNTNESHTFFDWNSWTFIEKKLV